MVQAEVVGSPRRDPLAALLDEAGVDTSSMIRVTGPGGLPALLWLCRHGYDQVGYLKPGAACPHEDVDVLLVAHACDLPALDRLLSAGPYVREGGVLVFLSPLPGADHGADPIHALLGARGYAVERCFRGAHRELHVARRRRPAFRKAA